MKDAIKTPKNNRRGVSLFLLLSVLAHALIMVSMKTVKAPELASRQDRVEVEYLEPVETAAADKSQSQSAQKIENQIVEQRQQVNDEVDEKTRLLSAFNQKVLRETRAMQSGKFSNNAGGGQPAEGQQKQDKKAEHQQKPERKNKEKGELPDLKDLTPKFALDPGPQAPPSEKTGDPSQSDDYLKDLKPGLQTLLSTKEFVYYAYYSRIKEALRQHWEPNVREKVKIIYRQGRNIASAKDRVTQVLVVLNSKGELLQVQVLSASGVQDLDSAAVEAFQNASPFPNPPKGMVDPDGTVKIRWDFVLEA